MWCGACAVDGIRLERGEASGCAQEHSAMHNTPLPALSGRGFAPPFDGPRHLVTVVQILRDFRIDSIFSRGSLPRSKNSFGPAPAFRSTSLKRVSRAISVLRYCPKTRVTPGRFLGQRFSHQQRKIAAAAKITSCGHREIEQVTHRRHEIVGTHQLGANTSAPEPAPANARSSASPLPRHTC